MTRPNTLLCTIFSLITTFHTATTSWAQDDGSDELVEMVVQLLGDSDKDMRALGLEQIRTQAPGKTATEKFAALLPKLPPGVQAELISALTDRGDGAARPAIVSLLNSSENQPVRVAAIRSLGFLGQGDDLQLLLNWLAQDSAAEKAEARTTLGRLPGDSLSRALAAELKSGDPALRTVLMEILVTRRAFLVASELIPPAADKDPAVRSAAMNALSQLGGPEHVRGMVNGILAAERGRERESAEKAVMLVCRRIEDADQAVPLLAAMNDLSPTERITVLPALGRVGGASALKIVKSSIASADSKVHQAGIRALCNWPDASVAPNLIQLAQMDKHSGDRTAALRALIRVAPLPDGRTDEEKLELLKCALPLCTRDEEKKLVLQRASAVRIPATLRFLVSYLDQSDFAQQACQSIVELAHHRSLREPNKAEFDKALDKVKQISQDAVVIDRANRYQKGETWVRQ